MPYIPQKDRKPYLGDLDGLLSSLDKLDEKKLCGHLNFCVSYLMTRLLEKKQKYVRANTIRGAVENALDEWYRRHVVPYEEIKREENGDV